MIGFTVECDKPVKIEKKYGDYLTIIHNNFQLELRKEHKVREFIFQIYTTDDEAKSPTRCFIEIIVGDLDCVFGYPYHLRHTMLEDYDKLRIALRPYMTIKEELDE